MNTTSYKQKSDHHLSNGVKTRSVVTEGKTLCVIISIKDVSLSG